MKLYISDLHFGHKNVLKFDERPFKSIEEMDAELIRRWNEKVGDDDDVYILGDVAYKSDKSVSWYLRQLKGRKHLIMGNHDRYWLYKDGKGYDPVSEKCFDEIRHEDFITDTLNGEKVHIHLYHYPIAEWEKFYHGGWLIYGHIHGRTDGAFEYMRTQERALNAFCGINGYEPVTIEELVENNKAFIQKHSVNHRNVF